MDHQILFLLAIDLSVQQFQMPLKGLSLVAVQQRVDRVSAKYRPGIGQVLTAYRPTIARHMIRSTLNRLSPVVGRVLIMYRSTCRPSRDRHVDHWSIKVSIDGSDRHLDRPVIDRGCH